MNTNKLEQAFGLILASRGDEDVWAKLADVFPDLDRTGIKRHIYQSMWDSPFFRQMMEMSVPGESRDSFTMGDVNLIGAFYARNGLHETTWPALCEELGLSFVRNITPEMLGGMAANTEDLHHGICRAFKVWPKSMSEQIIAALDVYRAEDGGIWEYLMAVAITIDPHFDWSLEDVRVATINTGRVNDLLEQYF